MASQSDITELKPQRDPKAERKALADLFSEYERVTQALDNAAAEVERLGREKSSIVEQVAAFGRGPYQVRGVELTPMRRTLEGGGHTWFFRSPSERTPIVVTPSATPEPQPVAPSGRPATSKARRAG